MKKSKSKWVWLILGIVVVISFLGIGYYVYDKLDSNLKDKEEDNSWVSEDDDAIDKVWKVIEDNTIFKKPHQYSDLDTYSTYLTKFRWSTYVSPKELTTSLGPRSDGFERVMADGAKVRFKATNETFYSNGLTEKLEYDVIFEGTVFKDVLSYSDTDESHYYSKEFYYYYDHIIDYNYGIGNHTLKIYDTYDKKVYVDISKPNVIFATIESEGDGYQKTRKLYYLTLNSELGDDDYCIDNANYSYYYFNLGSNENVHISDFSGKYCRRFMEQK